MPESPKTTVLTILNVIAWTLVLVGGTRLYNLPPKHLLDAVSENRELIIEHIKMDKCLK